jgi:hypothetical protein
LNPAADGHEAIHEVGARALYEKDNDISRRYHQ